MQKCVVIEDWKKEIAIAWLVKQTLMDLDKNKMFPYHLPEVAAGADQITQVEESLQHGLDPRYKEFLKHANGWRGFWHAANLFGTNDLISGPNLEVAEFQLSMLDHHVLHTSGVNRPELLPIAATVCDRDLFVITRPISRFPGTVIWFAGEEVERFPTFDDYFLAMVDYARQDVQWFKNEKNEKQK